PPVTIEEIVTASNALSVQPRTMVIWLHMMVIYEFWGWFTNKKWGNSTMPEPALPHIWKVRIMKEIQTTLNSRLLRGKERDLLKRVNSVNSLDD
ncbi:18370_t:CDS:1, partial [Dentiscutata erythropus]